MTEKRKERGVTNMKEKKEKREERGMTNIQ